MPPEIEPAADSRSDGAPSWRVRLAIAVGVGIVGALLNSIAAALRHEHLPGGADTGGDFFQIWYMVRALAAGLDPYVAGCGVEAACADPHQYYPLTAGLAAFPLGIFSPTIASRLFVGISSGLLAYALVRDGWRRMPMLLSRSFFLCALYGQWPALLVAASLLPGLEWLYTAKPQLGLALLASRPTRRALLLCAAFVAISLVVRPTWPLGWLRAASRSPFVGVPLLWAWFAPVLLAAVLRWRTPEGRLLLASSILPQTPYAYDQLVLWLVPRTLRESWILTGLSWAMFLAWTIFAIDPVTHRILLQTNAPYLIAFLYVPCLIMVLRRPNEGPIPAWLDRVERALRLRRVERASE